jgi:hypothetical protein
MDVKTMQEEFDRMDLEDRKDFLLMLLENEDLVRSISAVTLTASGPEGAGKLRVEIEMSAP